MQDKHNDGPNIPGQSQNTQFTDTSIAEPKNTAVKPTPAESLKKLLSLTGGSIFYCVSAFAIIYGVAQTIGPLLASGKNLHEALMCVLTLNVYELALLTVLVIIVVFRNVTDDAISLVVIGALFLIASGATLGTVGYREPHKCLIIGIVCCFVGLGKLYVLRKYIGFKIGPAATLGIITVLTWSFLTGTLISGFLLSGSVTQKMMKAHWLTGWYIFLGGLLLVVMEAAATRQEEIDANNQQNVFLRRYSMVWLFAVLLFAAGCAHSYAMAYMFAIKHNFGDYLPFVIIFSILIFEFLRSLKERSIEIETLICIVPLAATVIAMTEQQALGLEQNGFILWYRPVLLGIAAVMILALGFIHKIDSLKYLTIAYIFMALLNYSPNNPLKSNWHLAGGFLTAALLALGIIRKNIFLCVLAVFIFSIGLASVESVEKIAKFMNMNVGGVIGLCCGAGLFAICIGFGKKTPQLLSIFASFILMLSAFDYFIDNYRWDAMPTAIILIVAGLLVFLRTKHIAPLIILLIPIFYKVYDVGRNLSSWRSIIAGFFFLFIGSLFSYFKGHKTSQ